MRGAKSGIATLGIDQKGYSVERSNCTQKLVEFVIAWSAALAGCGAYAPPSSVPVDPGHWISAGSLGADQQADWGIALPWVPSVRFVPRSEVAEVTGLPLAVGATVEGTHEVLLAEELTGDLLYYTLEHELGHIYAGVAAHLTAGCHDSNATSQHVMCAFPGLLPLTAADFDYAYGAFSNERTNDGL